MEKALSKKSITSLKQNAEKMTDVEFKKQGGSMLSALVKVVNESMEQGKVVSKHFFNGVNKEIDVLSKMIDSAEYTSQQKIEFSNRIAKLVDKLQKKDIVKDVAIFASLGMLGVAIWQLFTHRK